MIYWDNTSYPKKTPWKHPWTIGWTCNDIGHRTTSMIHMLYTCIHTYFKRTQTVRVDPYMLQRATTNPSNRNRWDTHLPTMTNQPRSKNWGVSISEACTPCRIQSNHINEMIGSSRSNSLGNLGKLSRSQISEEAGNMQPWLGSFLQDWRLVFLILMNHAICSSSEDA